MRSSKLIHAYSYPALERRLSLMGATGQIKTLPHRGWAADPSVVIHPDAKGSRSRRHP